MSNNFHLVLFQALLALLRRLYRTSHSISSLTFTTFSLYHNKRVPNRVPNSMVPKSDLQLFTYLKLGKTQLDDYRKEEIIKLLNTGDKLDTFDEMVFKSLMREIKVTAPKEIEVSYNCGITVNHIFA